MPEPAGGGPPGLSAAGLRRFLDRHPPPSGLWIAYSGGLDSRVLLQLCVELRSGPSAPEISAVHVHHGLQPAADGFAEHCRSTCLELSVPFRLLAVDGRAGPGESPEAAARAARYRAFETLLASGEALLTAQHRDDQAETLLLQLLRGSGIAGLAAMPEAAPLGAGRLLRPLLGFSRAELCAYARRRNLAWIEDPSNEDLRYGRNFIRRKVLPLLQERWPAAVNTLSRSAGHCAEALQTIDSLADDLLRGLLNPERGSLPVAALAVLPEPDLRLVLRRWLRERGVRNPSARVLERIPAECLAAGPDRNPVVRWPEGEIRRYRGELFLLPPAGPFDASAVIPWTGATDLALPDANGSLNRRLRTGPGIPLEAFRKGAVTVRYRRGGEILRLAGREGSHELKKLFQEAAVPPWVRGRVPLIYLGGELAAVPGFWLAEAWAGPPEGDNVEVRWRVPEHYGTWWQRDG